MIYFIGQDWESPVKIGKAKNPQSRLKQLQTGNPNKLMILGTYEPKDVDDDIVEKTLHYLVREYRLMGEWFEGPAARAAYSRRSECRAGRQKIRFIQKKSAKSESEKELEKIKLENDGLKSTILQLRQALHYYIRRVNGDFIGSSMKEKRWWRSLNA